MKAAMWICSHKTSPTRIMPPTIPTTLQTLKCTFWLYAAMMARLASAIESSSMLTSAGNLRHRTLRDGDSTSSTNDRKGTVIFFSIVIVMMAAFNIWAACYNAQPMNNHDGNTVCSEDDETEMARQGGDECDNRGNLSTRMENEIGTTAKDGQSVDSTPQPAEA